MKKFKFVVLTVIISFFLSSCSDLVDEVVSKVCEVGVKEIRDEYNIQIDQIQNDPDLSQQEKDDQIATLTNQRNEDIQVFESECSL